MTQPKSPREVLADMVKKVCRYPDCLYPRCTDINNKACDDGCLKQESTIERLLSALPEIVQRTPGTVEVCKKCGYGKTFNASVDDIPIPLDIWGTCDDAECPIRTPSPDMSRETT